MFSKLTKNVPGLIYQYRLYPDGHSNFPYVSNGISEIYEVESSDILENAQAVFENLHPDDFEMITKSIKESAETMNDWNLQYRVDLPKKGVRLLEGYSKPEKLEDGSILWHGYIQDVTEKEKDKKHQHSLSHILSESLNEIYIFDMQTLRFLYANKGACENIGYSLDELLELTPVDIKPEITADSFLKLIEPLKTKEKIFFQTVHQRKNGTKYNVDIYLQLATYQDSEAYVAIILDVTKRIETEKTLAMQFKLTDSIIDNVPTRIFWKDLDGKYLGANKAFIEDANLSFRDEVIGKNDFEMPWRDKEAKLYRKDDLNVINSGIPKINYEETLTDDVGNVISVLTSKIPWKNLNGDTIGILGSYVDITEQNKLQSELEEQKHDLAYQAYHDALTGLPNRVLFNEQLQHAIMKAKRKNTKVALFFIDLDHFKEINDSFGHNIGDEVLIQITSRLHEGIRETDMIARLGGDEFTVILEDLKQIQEASPIAEKLLTILSESINYEDSILQVSSSIGISIYPDDGQDPQSLLKFADSAMYKAKDEGRNNYQYYSSEMTELAFERVLMETALREGIKNEEFIVYYQPQVDGTTNKLIGMEALVRWKHPTMGIVAPSKFIPLAESTGLIIELDRYVMKTAIKQIVDWYQQGLQPGVLAMNLSVKQLNQNDFVTKLTTMLEEVNCKPEWLELEVTESEVMKNPKEAIKSLQSINDFGIELAIDDFGTGYSSLAYLKKLPINKLKIDQAFIKDLPEDEEDIGITKAVIALAQSLNLKIIAEGVETQEQRDFIVANGCTNIQGYFYSKPVPANEFEKILRNGFAV